MNIVIIEDEKITAKDISNTILSCNPMASIIAELHSVEESVKYFENNEQPDLIFSDIRLGDGLSFEIFDRIRNKVPVIFCTAYNSYYTEAFKMLGIDYILKPVTKKAIQEALEKYQLLKLNFAGKKDKYNELIRLLNSKLPSKQGAVIIRHREKIIPLNINMVALFVIENGCVFAYTFEKEKFMLSEKMEELELTFSPLFFRANRQFLISRKAVKDASHYFNRKLVVNLTLPYKDQVLIGKNKAPLFIEWLTQS